MSEKGKEKKKSRVRQDQERKGRWQRREPTER